MLVRRDICKLIGQRPELFPCKISYLFFFRQGAITFVINLALSTLVISPTWSMVLTEEWQATATASLSSDSFSFFSWLGNAFFMPVNPRGTFVCIAFTFWMCSDDFSWRLVVDFLGCSSFLQNLHTTLCKSWDPLELLAVAIAPPFSIPLTFNVEGMMTSSWRSAALWVLLTMVRTS